MPTPRVESVNVGPVRTTTWRGRPERTGIWKVPTADRIAVEGVNLVGDDQADRRLHGGPDKAVYAYAVEDYGWWRASVGPLEPGTFGENLTTSGIDLNSARVGDRWRIGTAQLEVAQPRTPCFKLGIRMGDDDFPRRFREAGRPGVYLRIVEPGHLQAGDAIEVVPGHPPGVPIGAFTGDGLTADVVQLIGSDPRVPEVWREAARRALAR